MTDELQDRESEIQPKSKGDEPVSDLSSKKLNRDEEGKVKGGLNDGKHFPEAKLTL